MTDRADLPSLFDLTLSDLGAGLDAGRFSVVDIVKAYHARIDDVDSTFRSLIEVNPKALEIAAVLDQEQQRTGRRGPLHGATIVLKDNIVALEGMETQRRGQRSWREREPPPRDL